MHYTIKKFKDFSFLNPSFYANGGRGAHHFAKLNFSFILSMRKCKNNNFSKNRS